MAKGVVPAGARALLWLCASLLLHAVAHAQDEDPETGSRTSRTAEAEARRQAVTSATTGARPAQTHDDAEDEPRPVDFDYHLAVAGGLYAQDSRFGPLIDAAGELELKFRPHELSAGLSYLYDPFSTKTFNFADDDQDQEAATEQARIVQAMHELDADLGWQARWSGWLRTDLGLSTDAWWPLDERDQRLSLRVVPALRLGGRRGAFARLRGEGFVKKFPNYHEADRRIDSRGLEGSVEAGYDSGPLAASGGFEYRATDYLDARYDTLLPDGTVTRAEQSKDYLRSGPFASLELEPIDPLRVSLGYKLELNDSRHYDRRMTGRNDAGALVAKLIPSYFDYTRHRLTLRVRYKPHKTVRLELMGETWVRDFDTYEARDRDNVWTGEPRHDTNFELGFEGSYRLLRFGASPQWHELHALLFASHVSRRSNMQRELSFATNFDVTRAFVGLELRGP